MDLPTPYDTEPNSDLPMLSRLAEARVMAVRWMPGLRKFLVGEACEDYFGEEMTPDELRALAAELMRAAYHYDRAP